MGCLRSTGRVGGISRPKVEAPRGGDSSLCGRDRSSTGKESEDSKSGYASEEVRRSKIIKVEKGETGSLHHRRRSLTMEVLWCLKRKNEKLKKLLINY